ncbi:hypothetical protein ACS0TY_032740 [Phlomoides rotata]
MFTTRFDIEKFTEKFDFLLWKAKTRALLVQQGLVEALEPRAATTDEESSTSTAERNKILEKEHNTILLCLGDKALREVATLKTAKEVCDKLENLYMVNES